MANISAHTKDDIFNWFTPKPKQKQRVDPSQVIGGSIGGFEEYQSYDIQESTQETKVTKEEIRLFDTKGSISFKETTLQQISKEETKQPVIPNAGEKIVKATEVFGKATEEVVVAGLDLLKMVFGLEKKLKKNEKKENAEKVIEQKMRQQAMNEQARKITAEAKARQTKNSLEEYRKQVNKVLGITGSFEGTMDENGQLRTDIKASYEKAQMEREEAAEKAKKTKSIVTQTSKGKPGSNQDLRQNTMTEKTAGGSALTTVG